MGLSLQATHTETLISAALSLNGDVGLVSGPVPSLLRDSVFSDSGAPPGLYSASLIREQVKCGNANFLLNAFSPVQQRHLHTSLPHLISAMHNT